MFLGFALKPISIVAASVPNFRPDPIGEKLYRAHVYHQALFMAAIIACALLAGYLVHKFARQDQKPDASA